MKTYMYFLPLLFFSFLLMPHNACSQQGENKTEQALSILNRAQKKYVTVPYYAATISLCYDNYKDTGRVYSVRNTMNKSPQGKFYITGRNGESIYDLKFAYIHQNRDKDTVWKFWSLGGKMYGDLAYPLIPIGLDTATTTIASVKKYDEKLTLSFKKYNNKKYYIVCLKESNKYNHYSHTYYIDPDNYDLCRYIYKEIGKKNSHQYHEITFENISYKIIPDSLFDNSRLCKHRVVINSDSVYAMNRHADSLVGVWVAPISGKDYFTSKQDSVRFNGHVTLISFIRGGCRPGIIPVMQPDLQELKEHYKDNINMYGIDALDTTKNDSACITKRLITEGINFPLLMTPKSLLEQYHIKHYPVLFVVGKDGKIKYVWHDYTYMYKALIVEIDNLLKE